MKDAEMTEEEKEQTKVSDMMKVAEMTEEEKEETKVSDTMKDAEMTEEETKVSGIREKMEEITHMAYYYQSFNEVESEDWRNPAYADDLNLSFRNDYRDECPGYSSFKFPILPVIDGVVKPCSYSELENITKFKPNLTQATHFGRLFRGIITEGSEKRSVIVKTWDLLLPLKREYVHRPSQFCDEIELYETTNGHPRLAKLSRYCCEKRLAVVYDEEHTTVLSDVLLDDNFGWDKRIIVATQLADLLAWLHRKKIAVGSVTASSIMIDKEENIKVFDFGYILHGVNEDSEISLKEIVGRMAPEIVGEGWTLKSDVYIFGVLLLELITKQNYEVYNPDNTIPDGKNFVHPCFEEVDDKTASDITELTRSCTSRDPGERPTMQKVFDDVMKLSKAGSVGGKRKRDEKVTMD